MTDMYSRCSNLNKWQTGRRQIERNSKCRMPSRRGKSREQLHHVLGVRGLSPPFRTTDRDDWGKILVMEGCDEVPHVEHLGLALGVVRSNPITLHQRFQCSPRVRTGHYQDRASKGSEQL